MKEEWIEVGKQKPKEGQLVDILIGSGTVTISNVRFEAGRFWQYRTGPDAGLAYDPDSWRPAAMESSVDPRDIQPPEPWPKPPAKPAQEKPVRAAKKDGSE